MADVFVGKRVLLVENEALIALVLRDMLEELGFASVEHVVTLASAMASVQDRPPDIAVLDLHVTDGLTLPLAEVLARRGIRSIFVTGDFHAQSTYALDQHLILIKPFSPADFQTVLRRAFDSPLIA